MRKDTAPKTVYTFLMLVFITSNIFSQNKFLKTYGTKESEFAYTLIQTADKGFMIVGFTNGMDSSYLVKTDSLGNKQWSEKINNSPNYSTNAIGAIQTTDKGYLICFSTVVEKLDSLGNIKWSNTYWPYHNYAPTFNRVVETSGGYVLAGGSGVMSVVKIDYLGNILWSRTNGDWLQSESIGDIIQLGYDSCFYTINYNGTFKIVKFNKNGFGVWAKKIAVNGMTGPYHSDGSRYTCQIVANPDGKYISASIISGNYDELFTIDTSGTVKKSWRLSLGNYCWGVYNHNGGNELIVASVSGASLPGNSATTMLRLSGIDTAGNYKFSKLISGTTYLQPVSVKGTADGGIAILSKATGIGAGEYDMFLVKTDSLGNSACQSTNSNASVIGSVNVSSDTSLTPFDTLIFPSFQGYASARYAVTDTEFDICQCHMPVASFSYDSAFGQIKDNSNWATSWYWSFGDGSYSYSNLISGHNYQGYGPYHLCLTVSDSCGVDSLCRNVYYVSYPIGINGVVDNNSFNIYPNPSNGNFFINTTIIYSSIDVVDITGRRILSIPYSGQKTAISLQGHSNGLYFIKIISDKGTIIRKVTKD